MEFIFESTKKEFPFTKQFVQSTVFTNSGRLKGITNINLEKDQTADVWISQLKF